MVAGRAAHRVHESSRDGNDEIYVMSADGSNQRSRITNSSGTEDAPQWSPDGSSIAYTYFSDIGAIDGTPDFDVRIMNADGSNVRHPFSGFSVRRSPSWSADGKKLLMTQRDLTAHTAFTVCVAALTDDHCTPIPTSDSLDAEVPRWSPDGLTISYARRIGLADELHIIGPDAVDIADCCRHRRARTIYLVWRP